MEYGTIVKNNDTGRVGVVVPDLGGMMSACEDNEVLVEYEGESHGGATSLNRLTTIGTVDAAIGDPRACGAGRGKDCCAFLTCTANGFKCERFGNLRNDLIFRISQMSAQRQPKERFPDCQIFKVKEADIETE